jgi:hypothetical protein
MVRWVIWGGVLLTSFYAGAVVGFNKGVLMQLAMSGDDAVGTVVVLRQLQSGRIAEATRFLETRLDSQLAGGLYGAESFCSAFNVPMRFVFPDGAANHVALMSMAVEYRMQHPGPNAQVNDRLLSQLRSYGKPPRPGEGRCWPL